MNQQFSKVFGFVALTFLVGCATQGNENLIWSSADSQDVSEADSTSESIAFSGRRAAATEERVSERSTGPSYTTSQVSAAAGAAFGAGLGAVVGSATGNAAEGLAIGAVAGAASGALVGNEFQKRDEVVDQQRELMARQDERIQTQERQIQEIRRSLEDRFPTNKPSSSPKVSLDKYRGSPAAKSFAGSGVAPRARMNSAATPYAAATKNTSASSKSYGGKLASATPAPKKEIPVVNTVAKQNKLEPAKAIKTAAPVQNNQIATKTSELPPAATPIAKTEEPKQEIARAIPPVAEVKQPVATAPIAEVKQPTTIATAPAPTAKSTPVSTVAKMTSTETTGCKEAVDESRRGEEAISEADKLFYYRRAARLCPVESSYRVKIGQVYATLGKRDQAKGEFEKALEIDPENVVANEELSLLESNI